ncbi:MAG: VCBS repeat-containing protein, partial [Planctomycetes bacterium]|nr:VCBS repeat-containing protein [Planctomycetota bacterium]
DVLSASKSDDKIAWYENTDGAGSFSTRRMITTEAHRAQSVYAVDVDGDSDLDVLSASYDDNKVAWYENTDGAGNFGSQQVITTEVHGCRCVYAADLDGDGDMDVLSASGQEILGDRHGEVVWYENVDGAGDFGPQQVVMTVSSYMWTVYAADLDGDRDVDVLSVYGNKVIWSENTDGAGTFSAERVISTEVLNPSSVYAADLDGDGDMDVLSASKSDDKIAWYENTDGMGSFGPQQVITTQAEYAWSVYAADMDGDGDLDVLSASEEDQKIAWYENADVIAQGPEMTVLGSGLTIVDGDTTPRLADHTVFGIAGLDGAITTRTFTILNTGTEVLDLTGSTHIEIVGPQAGDFTVVAQPAATVGAGGESATFQIVFDPSALGLRTATVSVLNNDSDENPYDFVIQGTGVKAGDTDGDGDVDASDLATFTLNWAPTGSGHEWTQGDFDGDGDVDATDLATLALNWSPSGYATSGLAVGDAGVAAEPPLSPTGVSITHVVPVTVASEVMPPAPVVEHSFDAATAWVNTQTNGTVVWQPAPPAEARPTLGISLTALNADLDNALLQVLHA